MREDYEAFRRQAWLTIPPPFAEYVAARANDGDMVAICYVAGLIPNMHPRFQKRAVADIAALMRKFSRSVTPSERHAPGRE